MEKNLNYESDSMSINRITTEEEAIKVSNEMEHAAIYYFRQGYIILKMMDKAKRKKDVDFEMEEDSIRYQYTIGINRDGMLKYLVGYRNRPAPDEVKREVLEWAKDHGIDRNTYIDYSHYEK
jgi:hypothetical protein